MEKIDINSDRFIGFINRFMMKSTRARQLLSVLKPINNLPVKKRNQFIANCDKTTLCCLCEVAKNVLNGNVRLKPTQLAKLRKHKKAIRQLSVKRTSLRTKRRILRRGGFLGALIGPAIGLLTSLFAGSRQ